MHELSHRLPPPTPLTKHIYKYNHIERNHRQRHCDGKHLHDTTHTVSTHRTSVCLYRIWLCWGCYCGLCCWFGLYYYKFISMMCAYPMMYVHVQGQQNASKRTHNTHTSASLQFHSGSGHLNARKTPSNHNQCGRIFKFRIVFLPFARVFIKYELNE